MGDACEAFGTPVTGGNVSFYNENPEGAVFPTPTIGMLGLVDDVDRDGTTMDLKEAGSEIWLLSPSEWNQARNTSGSEYLANQHGVTAGDAPHLDLDEERAVQGAMLALIRAGIVESAHDVSDGGLAVCLAEKVLTSETAGAGIDLGSLDDGRLDATLFGEDHSRIVFTVSSDDRAEVQRIMGEWDGVQLTRLGTATEERKLTVTRGDLPLIDCPANRLRDVYEHAIPERMDVL
jgi:phosphoribosylformylglycinamidine synthase